MGLEILHGSPPLPPPHSQDTVVVSQKATGEGTSLSVAATALANSAEWAELVEGGILRTQTPRSIFFPNLW